MRCEHEFIYQLNSKNVSGGKEYEYQCVNCGKIIWLKKAKETYFPKLEVEKKQKKKVHNDELSKWGL